MLHLIKNSSHLDELIDENTENIAVKVKKMKRVIQNNPRNKDMAARLTEAGFWVNQPRGDQSSD